jgi:MFS family permease
VLDLRTLEKVPTRAGGWTVVGVSTTVNALAWGARSTFALYFVAMLEEFAWGRGPTALGYSLSWLGFVFFAPIAGWLSDRWGTRRVVATGGITLGIALTLTGKVTSLSQYYLCFGLLGAAGIAGMLIPSTTIVTRWFVSSRGTAMGVLSTGPGSAVVFYPLNAWLIAMLGWRRALGTFGCLVAAGTVLLTLLYREPPPAARPAGGAAFSRRRQPAPAEAWTLRRALGSVRLWAAFAMTGLGVIGFQIMATHQVAHAADHGVPRDTAVLVFAFAAGCMMAGNVLGGWLSDRVGRGGVFVLGTAVAILGILCFAGLRGPDDRILLLLYAVSGFGFGMRIAQLSTIPSDIFAGPHLGAILGVVQAGGGLGGAIGPYLAGWLFDVTRSYRLAFLAACVAVAGSAVAAWFASRPVAGKGAPAG